MHTHTAPQVLDTPDTRAPGTDCLFLDAAAVGAFVYRACTPISL